MHLNVGTIVTINEIGFFSKYQLTLRTLLLTLRLHLIAHLIVFIVYKAQAFYVVIIT